MLVGRPRERLFGQVHATIRVANAIDLGLVKRGMLETAEARELELSNVLVDTGATGLCLPRRVIEALGLEPLREVAVNTAAGVQTTMLYGDVRLQIEDRVGTFDCLELPGGDALLLSVTPLEVLGFEPDLQAQQLRKLPMGKDGSYLTVY